MSANVAMGQATVLYDKAEAFIKSQGADTVNKLLVGPALANLDEAVNILTDALVEKPSPADELWLTGLRAECLADMAVWSVTLGDAKNYAQQSIDDLNSYLAFTGQNQSDIDHAKFLLSRMQGIVGKSGNTTDKTPNWSSTVGNGKVGYLDDSVSVQTNYTIPIAIGVGVILLAGAAIAVKHHAAVTAHAALTANPGNQSVFIWTKPKGKEKLITCYDGNFPCGSVYYDLDGNEWIASPRIGIDSVHNTRESAKLRIQLNWDGRS